MPTAIIQARMGSSRLPGKVLRPLGPRSVLSWVVRAARTATALDDVVVATTAGADDEPLVAACAAEGVACVRGPVDDVLARFLGVLDARPADVVVRLTADCPLLDPAVIDMAVRAFDAQSVDYLSTISPRSLPRGLDVEVVAASALRAAGAAATGVERVHVTPYIYGHPDLFRLAGLTFSPPAADLRVTLDEAADAELLDAVVAALGDRPPAWRVLVAWLRDHPDVVALNAGVHQKAVEEG